MRLCQICGKELPTESSASRKYCQPCSKQHEAELAKIRQIRNNQKRAERRAEKPMIQKPRRTLLPEDRAFCIKCIYAGRQAEEYLCDYMLLTGKRRGCAPGKGCKKRIIKQKESTVADEKSCERCGALFNGSATTHLCPECRKEARRKNAIHAVEVRLKKNGR